jgi:hypothetical protein
MKKTHFCLLIIMAICSLLVVVFSGKERTTGETAVTGTVPISTVGKERDIHPIGAKKPDVRTPPTVVISNGLFVVDTREKLVYGSPEMEEYRLGDRCQAALHGAEAKVTLRVMDSEGKEVPDASVNLTFAFRQKNKPLKGLTDSNGLFVAQGTLTEDIIYRVTKAGYYETFARFFMAKAATRCVENGRWIPWNPTLEVALKEKRKPIPMYQNYIETVMPAGTNRLGFDFTVGDWVAPYGKGSNADMWYVYDETFIDRDNFYIKLSFVFPGENNGCYMRKTDNYSELVSEHEAAERGFESSYVSVIEQEKGKYTKENRFGENDYMIFRIRTKTDDQGKIISSHYGKIYGPVGVPHRWSKKFSFTYYLNPTPNDRNLEYDPKQNLVPEQHRHTMDRNLP